jgi:Helix-turn-helix domain
MKSYKYPAAVREHSRTKGVPKMLFIVLATYVDDNGECYPAYAKLVKATGLSLRSVQRALKEIPADELQIIERGRAIGHSTKYRILINCSQADDSLVANYGQTDYSQNGNHGQADDRTMVKSDVNYSQADHLTTQELPNELPKARKRAASSVADPSVPLILQTPGFLKAWADFDEYRRNGKKKKEWTHRAKELTLEECLRLGETRAITAINHSICNGYTGMFEPRNGNGSHSHKQKRDHRTDEFVLPKL